MSGEILLIDNVDSFTYNIADLLHRVLGRAPVVWRNDHPAVAADLERFAAIVVGPGPGRPQTPSDLGVSLLALQQRHIPLLGICLGHQGLAHLSGLGVREMATPRHGIVSQVEHDGTGLFEGVPDPFPVVRYHSLEVVDPTVEQRATSLRVTARAADDGCVMALADAAGAPRWGVQFHPESVLSAHGDQLIANFLRMAGVWPARGADQAVPQDQPQHRRQDQPQDRPQDQPQGQPQHRGRLGPEQAQGVSGQKMAPSPSARPRRQVHLCSEKVLGAGQAQAMDVWTLHHRLTDGSARSVWLDSSDGSGHSVIVDGQGPLAHEIVHRVGEHEQTFFDRLDHGLEAIEMVDALPELPFAWRPGYVGYLGYELKAETGGEVVHRSPWPDGWMLFADRGVVIDHDHATVHALWVEDPDDPNVAQAQGEWLRQVRAAVSGAALMVEATSDEMEGPSRARDGAQRAGAGTDRSEVEAHARPRDDEAAYLAKVVACQDQIARGESYEICLTTTFEAQTAATESDLYRVMREVSPVPHGVWLRSPEVSVLSCSPERFVSVNRQGVVEARPIKGTRPRGATPDEDTALAADLVTATKDTAENLMIVDLLRNDLHRVCEPGSVHVPEIFAVESFATVHQLVSTIRGRLAPGAGATDVLRSCFPGGSMTGAPKVRTMSILDRLEAGPRGIYSGAIGWIGLNGAMDTSIVIRSATYAEGAVTFGVGGAVTALSDPAAEYAEMRTKAAGLLTALRQVGSPGAG